MISFYIILSLVVPILALLGIIVVKMIRNRTIPDSRYTPFDYVTGQTPVEFHEEKETQQEEDDSGDGNKKDRHKLRFRL
ncbi:DUF3951 domain-containing protein [Paenibacillus sp. HJGM_3]|uniref:DUF3951 domain-containing protein n=1 Tax=Paenibacillus sp. HJGM_3 TaxID=3379816 RepID=UPI00385FA383